jgi:hypothetical protein
VTRLKAGSLTGAPRKKAKKERENRGLMRREKVLKVRLSSAELARLEQLAEAWGIATRAGTLRALLRAAGPPDRSLVAGDSLDMLLAEIPEFDMNE